MAAVACGMEADAGAAGVTHSSEELGAAGAPSERAEARGGSTDLRTASKRADPSQQKSAGRDRPGDLGGAPALDQMEKALRQIEKELAEGGSGPETALRQVDALNQIEKECAMEKAVRRKPAKQG